MRRIVWIDIAKAICIILVVIGHYIPETHPLWYGEMRNVIYTFHMPLFMFASGYIYIATKKEISYSNFLWKKVKRLMIPYLIVSVLVVTIKLCTQSQAYVENPVTPLSYFKILYLPEAGYFLWFIWALWWMFILIPLFRNPQSRLGLLFVAALLPLAAQYIPEEFCLKEFSMMLQYFVMGVVAYDWKHYFLRLKQIPLLYYCIAFSVIEMLPYIGVEVFSLLTATMGIAFILRGSYSLKDNVANHAWGKIIMLISTASYIIYLLHTTFEGFAKALILKLPYLSDLSNDIMFCVGAVFVISTGVIVPVLLYKYVLGRYKITKVLFGL